MKVNLEMLAAIYKLGTAVICADVNVDPVCAKPLSDFFYGINGFNDEAMQRVADYANKNESMTAPRAVELVVNFDIDAKKKIVNLLASIVRAEQTLSEKKLEMFNGLRSLCGLPEPDEPIADNSEDVIAPTFLAAKTNGLAYPFQSQAEDWRELDADIAEHIGAERTEVVRFTAPLNALSKRLGLVDCHLVFLVDRNGYQKEDIGDNMTGTILYGSGHEILGNIVFALETDKGYEIKGFTSARLIEDAYIAINAAVGELLRLE